MAPERIAFLLAVGGFTLAAGWIDARTGKLPNKLTVPVFCVGLLFNAATGLWHGGWSGLATSLGISAAGFAVGFGLLWVMWMTGAGGAGDVKFMGALGAWLGPRGIFAVFIVGGIFVALLSFVLVAWKLARPGRAPGTARGPWEGRFGAGVIPWGVPLAAAAWCVALWFELSSLT